MKTCFGHLTDKRFEKALFTGMMLIDLKKVFDTIDHQILLKKMKYLDFSENLLHGLNLCAQNFNISSINYSSSSNLLCGISEGSILSLVSTLHK